MSYNYNQYVSRMSDLTVIASTSVSVNFQLMIDGSIEYAEQRMYRELDLLATRVTGTGQCTAGTREAALPTTNGTFLVVEDVVMSLDLNSSSPTATTNVAALTNVSVPFLDASFSNVALPPATPRFWAMRDNANVLFGPTPTSSFFFQVYGTIRPTPLSSSNTTTILTTMLPDLFIAASMVYAAGYMRDFGGQSDNPNQSASWESQYQALFRSAGIEEIRKKYQSEGWTNQQPNPVATPPRV